jgi:hypothetical protein
VMGAVMAIGGITTLLLPRVLPASPRVSGLKEGEVHA